MLRRHEWKSLCLHPHMPFLSIPCFDSFRHQSHDEPWCFSTLITFAPRDDSSQGARKHLQNWSTAREASLWGVARGSSAWVKMGPKMPWVYSSCGPIFQREETFVAPRALAFDPSNVRQRTSMSKLSEIVLIAHMQLVAQVCCGCSSASWKPWLMSETNAPSGEWLDSVRESKAPPSHSTYLLLTYHTALDSLAV